MIVRINRIIKRRLQDADGNDVGDLNAAIAVNVGEAGGSTTHVESHSRIVQRSGNAAQARTPPPPDPPSPADDPKEDA